MSGSQFECTMSASLSEGTETHGVNETGYYTGKFLELWAAGAQFEPRQSYWLS